MASAQPADVRWSQMLAAISLATDTGMAQPLETGLATCLVATTLAQRLGLSAPERQRVYQLSLLQHIGCTAASAQAADIMGDELVMRAHAATLDFADRRQMMGFLLAHVGRTQPLLARPGALMRAVVGGRRLVATAVEVCEAAQLLGRGCGCSEDVVSDLGGVMEYWDGGGFPGVLRGPQIPVPALVVQVATLAVAAHRVAGVPGAVELVGARSGRSLGPEQAAAFLADPQAALQPPAGTRSLWDAVIDAEPVPSPPVRGEEIDRILRAIADFVDLKAPCLAGHSSAVAALAADAAVDLGLADDEVRTVRRAGWVHDLGRIGVSSAVWNHPGPLSADQWERVRLHPYYTDRVLERTPFLRTLAEVASAHHERADGSGYYRGTRGAQLTVTARLLAAADTYHAMIEPRPHRGALTARVAAKELQGQVDAGRLDARAASAVLRAAGHRLERGIDRDGGQVTAGLTAREVEILQQVVHGLSIKQIAGVLTIAPKTVDGHLQRIYAKIGVSTRAGATLFAIRHDLVLLGAEDGEISP